MLNKIWPLFIIISFIYAFISGNIEKLNNGIFESTKKAVELCLTFLGTMCLWNGIMNIAYKSNLINFFVKILNPIIKYLFPEINKKEKIKKEISMNIIANIFGLGNAATPLGIKAMESMQEENENKNTLSNSMMIFIVLNTASLQLIPTTIIAIRSSLGSENPFSIIMPVWCASICSIIVAIIVTKILIKNKKSIGKFK
jgi:spore maturation protein A